MAPVPGRDGEILGAPVGVERGQAVFDATVQPGGAHHQAGTAQHVGGGDGGHQRERQQAVHEGNGEEARHPCGLGVGYYAFVAAPRCRPPSRSA
jgi:hypothetical protein